MFASITAKPGSSRQTKTGAWRTVQRPKFLQQECVACRLCLLVCPEGCVTGKEKNSFKCDYNYCKGCGLCAAVCPKKDILMVEEGEKK